MFIDLKGILNLTDEIAHIKTRVPQKTESPRVSNAGVVSVAVSNQNTTAQTSSWLGRTVSTIYPHMTLDNIMQASIVAGVALGGLVAATNGDAEGMLDGLGIATLATSVNCMLWAFGCAAKGEYSKAGKRLVVGVALAAAFGIENSLSKTLGQAKAELSKARKETAVAWDEVFKGENTINAQESSLKGAKNEIERLNQEALKAEGEIAKLKQSLEAKDRNSGDGVTINDLNFLLKLKELFAVPANNPVKTGPAVVSLKPGRQIVFGTTYIAGNAQRDHLSELVDQTHREYAERWNIKHNVVTKNLLKRECDRSENDSTKVDCVPYWNKIAVIRKWLNEEQRFEEEWRVMLDDDMPVTNMKVDPSKAIDALRRGKDTSVIVARDVHVWNGDPKTAVNTGLLFVRKDDASREFFNTIWEKRNSPGTEKEHCLTLGTCKNQDTLHEQTAMANALKEDRDLLDLVVTVVMPRDTYDGQEIAINTFERVGCFVRDQAGWGSGTFNYESDGSYPEGAWRVGDWMGQTAGVPINGWYCQDKEDGKPPGPIREDKLRNMIAKTIR